MAATVFPPTVINTQEVTTVVGCGVPGADSEFANSALYAGSTHRFTNLYVKNFTNTMSDEDFRKLFEKYGVITSAVVMRDAGGKSKGFGFVNFEKPDAARAAVEQLNGTSLDDKVLYVGKAQKKAEREAELKARFEQEQVGRFEKLKEANLYMKNLDDSINDEKLKELFSRFGTVTSCKVLADAKGIRMGAGFVAFSTVEEAATALKEMNGKMIGRKPLYVAVAQRKEERRAKLHAYFAQMHAPTPAISLPVFHAVPPRIAPTQVYFSQASPGLLPYQGPTGFGFHPHLMPGVGLRPSFDPNLLVPYPQIQQHPQRFGVINVGHPQQQWVQLNPSSRFTYIH